MIEDYFKNTLSITVANNKNVQLNKNSIVLFDASAVDISDYNLPAVLSEFELNVINQRKKPQAKQEYLATRLLLKQLLKILHPAFASVPLNAISSQFNQNCAKLQLHVNEHVINACLSHSHGLVGAALNIHNDEFGFDIEKLSLKRPFEKLAKHFYHPAEIALISSHTPTQHQADTFFRIWTLKEALAKATSRPIAKLLSPNVFDELSQAKLRTCSNVVATQSAVFDLSIVHKKSTDWRCFLLTDLIN